ncbi:hypothetical protein [Nocardia sp. CNY236]|uniref:hypothetical protein n=1 Tax=Nocardia sp. CNY236 TaxID=1169152 RepID=UPI00042A388D|nr:hypothetical protein [Nocardia sp. CNY236]
MTDNSEIISLCQKCVYMIGSALEPPPDDIAAADAMARNWPEHVLSCDSGNDSCDDTASMTRPIGG